jgi:purine-binding chemotaxis protein CheW
MSDYTTAQPGQFLTFQLMAEQYGVPINSVREINRVGEITPVPRTPPFVKGVMNLRGKIIPVINLRVRFGMPSQDYTRDTCIIVIDTDFGQVGMIVDAVKEVADLGANQIEPAPVLGNEKSMSFIRGMGKLDDKVIILVDVVSALSQEHITEMHQAVIDHQSAA